MKGLNVASLLQQLRKTHGYTQSDLADKLGVSFQAVSKWERGENLPDAYTLLAIADIYHVTVDEILRGKLIDKHFADKVKHRKMILFLVGLMILVISPVSIFVFGYMAYDLYVPVILTCAAIAVPLIIYATVSTEELIGGTMNDLEQKRRNEIIYTLAAALFLTIGFMWGLWHPGWIIFIFAYVATLVFIPKKIE
jgi:transcriptional regulator with XRE-family HTH domain